MIVRSRQVSQVSFALAQVIRKEPSIRLVNYGSFRQAIQWLAEDRVELEDIWGQHFTLMDYEKAFLTAKDESKKIFFKPQL